MPVKEENWTVIKMINWSSNYLAEKKIENSRLCAELLLAHILKSSRVDLYLNFDRPLEQEELSSFKKLLLRCATHEPIQYVLGSVEFYGIDFKVNPKVLIPRPETELLVEKTIELARQFDEEINVLDVGTGSGCIAVALANNLPHAKLAAVDISTDALEIARQNAQKNGIATIDFHELDILSDRALTAFEHKFDIIVSNPPYIASAEKSEIMKTVRDFEPEIALFADDPLIFYKRLAGISSSILNNKGALVCEIGFDQGQAVKKIYLENKLTNIDVLQDYQGHDRIVIGFFGA